MGKIMSIQFLLARLRSFYCQHRAFVLLVGLFAGYVVWLFGFGHWRDPDAYSPGVGMLTLLLFRLAMDFTWRPLVTMVLHVLSIASLIFWLFYMFYW